MPFDPDAFYDPSWVGWEQPSVSCAGSNDEGTPRTRDFTPDFLLPPRKRLKSAIAAAAPAPIDATPHQMHHPAVVGATEATALPSYNCPCENLVEASNQKAGVAPVHAPVTNVVVEEAATADVHQVLREGSSRAAQSGRAAKRKQKT